MSKQMIIKAMEDFKKAALKLSEVWFEQDNEMFELVSDCYPFLVNFEEMVDDIGSWLENVRQALVDKEWTSYHTGGGIWCYEKEFTTTDGERVIVQAFKDGAQIKDSDSFIIDLEEFTTGLDYERFTTEQMREITEACLRIK